MKRILHEPLLHFLLLGAAIFAAYSVVSKGSRGEPGTIVVTQGQLASMWESFSRTRQRPPTSEEWEGLIRARVREEAYYREALALGLDKDDAIIRRRLQQKMEFIFDDGAEVAEPTDAELQAYLQAHAGTFRLPRQFTFRHVFLDPQTRGKNLARDAAQLRAQLSEPGGDAGFAAMGDPFLLDRDVTRSPAGEIARQFGDEFAATLGGLEPGQWQGPVESSFGAHLVFVGERADGRVPALAEVRDAVRREWETARRLEAKERSYQQLLARYTVTVESPEPATTADTARVK